ncbi:S-adenosylmethionine decarboxylase [Exidia glandulosa HHB12029]|uniref:adenosylmethionine decarboxylase n=1 Tax=Exidia glandulosa HHB12029 TaxID=1314781 RepID=A0A165E7E7_EXIGL|nr:S-adenosylmethionine decarboxylase [Exidia glandulosa HHB12029]
MGASDNIAPFEGPEKLLEIWFAPYASAVPPVLDHPDAVHDVAGRVGLRAVKRHVWEDMLAIVKCKVLSVVEGAQIDAYLLSESSFFVFPHKLILKTCGTTLNLLGLPRILAIAANVCGMHKVWRCFYSRKSFMFPERQSGPHRDWGAEVEYLDDIFKDSGGGAAYTVGKVNGDHWLLYMTTPHAPDADMDMEEEDDGPEDYTIELLMSDLAPEARTPFFTGDLAGAEDVSVEQAHAQELSKQLGITNIFPASATTLDAYSFVPCGYSANALVTLPPDDTSLPHQPHHVEEGYYTIHVTPEEGWSYASFECNVQLSTTHAHNAPPKRKGKARMPDLQTLVQRVVQVFQPGRLSLTLFVSAPDSPPPSPASTSPSTPYASESELSMSSSISSLSSVEPDGEEPKETPRVAPTTVAPGLVHTASTLALDADELYPEGQVERAQRAFLQALAARGYRRTDKINYEFGGYDLAFASFERKKTRPPAQNGA